MEVRMALGLTQAQMAQALGISRDAYAKYDTGKRPVPDWLADKVADLQAEALMRRLQRVLKPVT